MGLKPEPENYRKSAAFSRRTVNLNRSAHHIHNAFYNGKAQSGAVNSAEGCIFFPFEGFVNTLQEIFADTDSVVFDHKLIHCKIIGKFLQLFCDWDLLWKPPSTARLP